MKEQYPLISVIVPIYNVGKYLPQCLESLCAQTYPNFEIILVDDGSTDNSSIICDQYAKRDARFTVIHQPNSGSVKARQAGVKQAKGELLSFVDSDDWVETDFLTHLYKIRAHFKADVSVCAPFGQFSRYKSGGQLVCGQEKALQIILTDKFFAGYLWNKLYPISYWKDIKWPSQNMFEDLFLNMQIFNSIEKVVFSSAQLYHYRVVANSISHQKFQSDKLFYFSIIETACRQAKKKHMNSLYNYLIVRSLVASLRNFLHYFRSRRNNRKLLEELKKILENNLKNFFHFSGLLTRFFLLCQELLWVFIGDLHQILLSTLKGNKFYV